jgi:2-polyprenyl-3-methyl-5-hydroxy-6-metoxy-1,4-benzoquinol methylase
MVEVYNFKIVKLYQENSAAIYFGQIDNPYDRFLSERYVLPYLKNKRGRILDFGCGAGRNSVALAKMGFDLVSVDSNAKALNIAKIYARNNHVRKNIRFIKGDVTAYKAGELGKFDYCVLQEVIEHDIHYQKAVDFIYSSLKKGGVMILTTQYNPKLWNILDDYAQHVKRFTKAEIEEAVKKFSRTEIIISGFPFLRLVHYFYCKSLMVLGKKHSTPKFMSHKILLFGYTKLFPLFLKIDGWFNFTELGRQVVVYAEK